MSETEFWTRVILALVLVAVLYGLLILAVVKGRKK